MIKNNIMNKKNCLRIVSYKEVITNNYFTNTYFSNLVEFKLIIKIINT